jgi:hypothetical protein
MTSPTVEDLVDQIRDLAIEFPYAGMTSRTDIWHQDWSRVCAGMDALGDVEYAIRDYNNADRVGYLHIYGLLQSLVVAQDAANLLREQLTDDESISWATSPEFQAVHRVREIRNESIGHPTASRVFEEGRKTKRQAGVGIVRVSMSKTGFTYYRHDQRKATPVDVDTAQVIRDNNDGVTRILAGVVSTMRGRAEAHRLAFIDRPLKPVWDEFSETRLDNFDDLAAQKLREVIERLDVGFEERCGDLETSRSYEGIRYYREKVGEQLARSDFFHNLGAPRHAGDELRDAWRQLGKEITALDGSFTEEF